MSEKKKFESGAQKRKLLKEKEIRDKEFLKKIPKLTGFFKPVHEQGKSSSSLTTIGNGNDAALASPDASDGAPLTGGDCGADDAALDSPDASDGARSEERRVGKECRL